MEPDIGHLNINSVTRELRKDGLSLKNRLQSIIFDSFYVDQVSSQLKYPVIPNERCGLWYVPAAKQTDTCYFKSTDGHTNQWLFSMRRLNLHLLPILGKNKGIVIVDSTRKGKLMPDALLKTIPMWCAVLNYILYEDDETDPVWDDLKCRNWLRTPTEIISVNEHNEMVKRIPGFAKEVTRLGLFNKDRLIRDLGAKKPLVPNWHYPGKVSKEELERDCFRLYCVTASKRMNEPRITLRHVVDDEQKLTTWYYIQGSADDHELWATKEICQGNLNGKLFWESLYNSQIIDGDTGYIYDWLNDEDLTEKINNCYSNIYSYSDKGVNLEVGCVKNDTNDTNIILGVLRDDISYSDFLAAYPQVEQLIVLSTHEISQIPESTKIGILQYKIESSKKGSKQLREILPKLVPQLLQQKTTMVLCDTGKDIGPGFVVLLLCKYYDLNWKLLSQEQRVNKDLVKMQLNLLCNVQKVNPSRNTLQSINTYLMN